MDCDGIGWLNGVVGTRARARAMVVCALLRRRARCGVEAMRTRAMMPTTTTTTTTMDPSGEGRDMHTNQLRQRGGRRDARHLRGGDGGGDGGDGGGGGATATATATVAPVLKAMRMRGVLASGPGASGYAIRDDLDVPEPADDEVLLRTVAVGVCCSDAMMYAGGEFFWGPGGRVRDGRVIPGHEVVGEVVAKGKVTREGTPAASVEVGQRVVVEQGVPCGECWFCRRDWAHKCDELRVLGQGIDGGFAEYMVVPSRSVCYPVPHRVPGHHAAFVEPLVIGVHAVDRAGAAFRDTFFTGATKDARTDRSTSLSVGVAAPATRASLSLDGSNIRQTHTQSTTDTEVAVAVVGGCGAIGLGVIAALRHAYGSRVRVVAVDADPARLALASGTGADIVVNCGDGPNAMREVLSRETTGRGGCDVYFECAGHPSSVTQGLESLRKMGTMVHLGIWIGGVAENVNWNLISAVKELQVIGSSLGGSRASHTWERAIDIIDSGALPMDDIVTNRCTLDGIHAALENHSARRDIKTVLEF